MAWSETGERAAAAVITPAFIRLFTPAALILAVLASPALAESGRLPLAHTPPQVGSPPRDPEGQKPQIRPRPPWRSRDRIVYAFDKPAREVLAFSLDLSRACQLGRFVQRIDMLYRAFGPEERPLGVAYGTMAINLYDPGRLRRAGTVYFFAHQDYGRCQVFTAEQEAIRPFFVGP